MSTAYSDIRGGATSNPAAQRRILPALRYYYILYVTVIVAGVFTSLVPEDIRFTVNYLGEILTVCSVPFAILGFQRMSKAGRLVIILFAAFALVEIVSSLLYPMRGFPQFEAAAVGLLLDAKLFILMMSTAYFVSRDIQGVAKYLEIVLWILIGLLWLNLPFMLRDIFDGSTNIYGNRLLRRAGFPTPTGIYHHKAILSQMSLLGVVAALTMLKTFASQARKRFIVTSLVLGVVSMVVCLSIKELASLLIIGILYASQVRGTTAPGRLYAFAIIGGLLAVGVLSTENRVSTAALERVDRYTGEEAENRIRNLLIATSLEIAEENFPLGTGPGSFASEPSRSFGYSPVYVKYHFYKYVGGRDDGEVQFLLDGFWPKILGEGGVLGLIFYLSAIVILMMQIIEFRKRFPDAPFFLFVQFVWTGVLPITIASGILTNERFVLLLAFSGACLVNVVNQRSQNA